MKSGFPDYHQFPERDHGDESFWPSFTDIMMVITMVFLLVTVMAITNNWKLVTDLKASVQAERLAAEQALDKEAQNNSLEDQMVLLQKRLVDANNVAVDKQVANTALQEELSRILAKVSSIEKELEASLKSVQEREKQLDLSSQQIDMLKTDRDKQLATLASRAQALVDLQGTQEASQQQVVRLQAALKAEQADLQKQRADQQTAATDSASRIEALKKSLENANTALLASQKNNQKQLADLQEQLQQTEKTLGSSQESQQLSEKQLEAMRAEVLVLEQTKRDEATALEAMRSEMAKLQDLRAQDETKLTTLKSEFDTLDTKYQKLLRPARSSTGKHVVSVWFSKQSGREVYRIRDSDEGGFVATTRKAMADSLAKLKDKYGKELYVKVIIPENSGLSYSDAWRFTTEMQRAYDYYYQNDE